MAVIGDREVADGMVAPRRRDVGELPPLAPDALVDAIADLSARRAPVLEPV
jgi:hypothetical protein